MSCLTCQLAKAWPKWQQVNVNNSMLTMQMKVAQLCPTFCDPMDYTVHGILQARILEWVAYPFSKGSSQPRNRTCVSCLAGRFLTNWATREAKKWKVLCCVPLCNPMDYTVHGLLQARILEWVAFPFSRGSSNPGIEPRCPSLQVDSLPAESQW